MKPTKDQIRRFKSAATCLAKLGEEGCEIYLAEDHLHLMNGPDHDKHGNPLTENSVAFVYIPGSGGGAWL